MNVVSPDGRYVATLSQTDQGALGGEMFVDVHRHGLRIPYVDSATVLSTGSWYDMELRWLDSRTLSVRCPTCLPGDTRDRVPRWRDVVILFPSFGEGDVPSRRR